MVKKVLVAYGSRYGTTEEVSQEIANILEENKIKSTLLNLRKTKERKWPSIEEFDGILVGSGIKISKWTKEPKKFLEKYKEEFKEKGKILGMFVCSGSASIPENKAQTQEDYLKKVMNDLGVHADIYEAFGGVFDFSKDSKIGFLEKKMLSMAAKEMEKEFKIGIDRNARNDFRDWDEIREFAKRFAEMVGEMERTRKGRNV